MPMASLLFARVQHVRMQCDVDCVWCGLARARASNGIKYRARSGVFSPGQSGSRVPRFLWLSRFLLVVQGAQPDVRASGIGTRAEPDIDVGPLQSRYL
ncbi:hypothetical protein HYFRA_00001052 [Hymenoscyphus fraxineus]|uniref:Uncharacterized protein n=1 Tax=Hymenoscyphus fraxineus TaxID=746836 RepID=A0A9N9KUL4_9HELO|nr:hypothetical protein HYFRA_00001052 [Hymenoscyphus fraxineus]